MVRKKAQMFDLGRLEILFKRVGSLPPLPSVVHDLIEAIDGDVASAFDLEKIITSDPVLVAEIMRAVGSSPVSISSEISSLRKAIILLGHRSIRAIAIGFAVRSVSKLGRGCRRFDTDAFVEHSTQVALLARYFYSRRSYAETNDWTTDEVFAAALLHDFGFALLAHIEPDAYDRIYAVAQVLELTLDEAFEKCFGAPIGILGAATCEAWGLPEIFQLTQRYFSDPIRATRHVHGVACIGLANYVVNAELNGVPMYLPPYLKDLVRVPTEEITSLVEMLKKEPTLTPGIA